MRPGSWVKRGLTRAAIATSGAMLISGGCSSEALRALIIGLDAAAGQIDHENEDISFSDWLDSEFHDVFDHN